MPGKHLYLVLFICCDIMSFVHPTSSFFISWIRHIKKKQVRIKGGDCIERMRLLLSIISLKEVI
jgi:hypothetical protein